MRRIPCPPMAAAALAAFLSLAGGCAGMDARQDEGIPEIRLNGESSGPVLMVVAGQHGDEPSGPEAARRLVSSGAPARGLLILLPSVFPEAEEAASRSAPGALDMNRSFPGEPRGDLAARRADSLFRLIRRREPALVLDLHESDAGWTEGTGPCLVVPALPSAAELALRMLEEPGMGEFSYTGGPPSGSLAAETSRVLRIPVLVVEIPDALPMERRVELHLRAVRAAEAALGMRRDGAMSATP